MRLSALLVLLASSLFLACGGDDDQSSEPTEVPGGSQAAAASPPPETTAASTSAAQPTDTPVPPTETETQPPPTVTATSVPPTQAPPTPTPEPGTIVIQLVSSSPGLTPSFAVSGSAACVPNAFPLAAGNATTLTCGNGNVTLTITVPAPPGVQPNANPAACSVEDEGATPGASSGFNPAEIPDAVTVVLRGVLLDYEDVGCVITLP
jgi:hypothetical protein